MGSLRRSLVIAIVLLVRAGLSAQEAAPAVGHSVPGIYFTCKSLWTEVLKLSSRVERPAGRAAASGRSRAGNAV